MRRILALALALITLLSLVGCGGKYKAVKSTKEEARVVMTFSVGGEEYEVKYELYRALFLGYKSQVDGGDSSVWSGADAEKYVKEIDELIISRAAEIYSVIALAEELGFKPYSGDVDDEIEARIEMSVDGGGTVVGFGGDYDAYLASLKEMNLNYSVQTLMLRYSICLEMINEYYLGVEDEALGHLDGDYVFSKEDVKSYYMSDECVRVFHAFVGKNKMSDSKERIDALREDILAAESDTDIALLIINRTTAVTSDLLSGKNVTGIVLGRDTISDGVYGAYRDTAFSLEVGEVSDVIEIGGAEPGYYVIYVLEKSTEHFESCYEAVKNSYLDNVIGKKLDEVSLELMSSVEYSDVFETIDHKSISMN